MTRTMPRVGSVSPSSISTVVVLPAPLGPSSPNTSPARIVRSSESTAVKSPYCLVSRRATMTASSGTSARIEATVRRRR